MQILGRRARRSLRRHYHIIILRLTLPTDVSIRSRYYINYSLTLENHE